MKVSALRAVCLESGMPRERYASTAVCLESGMPRERYASTAVCLESCMPRERYASRAVCLESGMPREWKIPGLNPVIFPGSSHTSDLERGRVIPVT